VHHNAAMRTQPPPGVPRPGRRSAAVVLAVLATLTTALVAAAPAAAATPTYVVVGDDPNVTGDAWGLHESYFSDLRGVITNAANFGSSGTVNASFTIGAPRALPLTTHSLDGVDVYFVAARDIDSSEAPVLQAFVQRGGALILNSNAPGFFDATSWLGFTMSPRVVYGDGPAPYDTTHRAPTPSSVVAGQTNNPVINGPFGSISTFNNWHTVAGFTTVPAAATVLARTTLTGPDDNGSAHNITITNVATLAVIPAGNNGPGSGPIVISSDVDTYSNAYTTALGYPTDSLCTLTGTTNGTLARNTFAWIAAQKATPAPTTGLLRATTSPAVPAQIIIDGQPADSWGLTWLSLGPGSHTVAFTHIEGYTEPPPQTITITNGQTTTVVGTYTPRGSLRVLTNPALPATISVDGTPRDNWGMWTDLPTGSHQICFGPVAGYAPPNCQNTTLTAAQTTTITGTYTAAP
jgi:hypothetical protein